MNKSNIELAARQFASETTEHQMTILHEDGLYRHLRCRKSGTSVWGWDIITWPGHLAISGDLGAFTFRRLPDMLEFFTGPANPGYWLEKCTAWDRNSHPSGVVSMRRIEQCLDGDRLPADVREELAELDGTKEVGEAIRILMHRVHPDAWDWDITEPDHHALRALHAISWTVTAWRQRGQAVVS